MHDTCACVNTAYATHAHVLMHAISLCNHDQRRLLPIPANSSQFVLILANFACFEPIYCPIQVAGRTKSLFSTMKKLLRLDSIAAGGRAPHEVHDILASRCIVTPHPDLPAPQAEEFATQVSPSMSQCGFGSLPATLPPPPPPPPTLSLPSAHHLIVHCLYF